LGYEALGVPRPLVIAEPKFIQIKTALFPDLHHRGGGAACTSILVSMKMKKTMWSSMTHISHRQKLLRALHAERKFNHLPVYCKKYPQAQ